MSAITRRQRILTSEELWAWGGGLTLAALTLVYGVWAWGNHLEGLPSDGVVTRLFQGDASWTDTHTRVATQLALCATVLVMLFWAVDRRIWGPRKPITRAYRVETMAKPADVKELTKRGREKAAQRDGGPGAIFFLGYLARTRTRLYFGHEDTGVVFTGPRWNKSTSIAEPAIIEAPGPVLATSNKPDVIQRTMAYRRGPLYIFDPMNIYQEEVPTPMYWDPLSYIRRVSSVQMVEKATTLAQRFLFAAGGTSKSDPHWGNAARDIMGALLLAAAIDTQPRTILDVYRWVTSPGNTEPVNILRRDGRFPMVTDQLDDYAHHPDKMRGSEYGTAATVLSFLAHDTVRPWVTPGEGRIPFYPDMAVTGTATIYLLSREGAASTGALTAALTAAVYEAARDEALSQGGRLEVPMVMVLDEIANVARWEELPDLYTHMGSQGILPIALFQSHAQGKRMWGEEQMALLLSVCSVLITGGNVKGDSFHRAVVNMVGKYIRTTTTESWSKGTRSTNRSTVEEDTVSVADLRKLPKQYSLMFTGGVSTIILRHVPRWRRRYRKAADVSRETSAPTVTAPVVHRDYPAGENPAPRRASGWGSSLAVEEEA